jgi:hypothetical protein
VLETASCSAQQSALDAIVLLLQQQSKQFEQMNSQFGSLVSELSAIKMSIASATNSQQFLDVTVATIECGQTAETGSIANCGMDMGTCV